MKHLFATDYNLQFNIWIFSVLFKCVFVLVTEDFFVYSCCHSGDCLYVSLCDAGFHSSYSFFFLFLISQHLVLIKGPYGSPHLMHSSSTEDGKLRICAVTFIPERWKTVSDEHCDRQIQTARHRNTNRWSWNVDDTGINMNEKRLQNVILYVNCCCRHSLKSSFCASCLHPVKPCCWFELLASNKVTYKVSFSFETVCY